MRHLVSGGASLSVWCWQVTLLLMSNACASLTAIVERWQLEADGNLLDPVFLGDDAQRPGVLAAWRVSDDPFAMLLLMQILNPGRDVSTCDELVAGMTFFPPMARVQSRMAKARPGMTYNGPSLYTFLFHAQRIRQGLRSLSAEEREAVAPRLAEAIRSVVTDPYQPRPCV